MPQLDVTSFAPQLIWLALSFGLLYFFMARLVLPRVGGVIAARQARIAGDLDEAERLKQEAQAAEAAHEAALREARAREVIAENEPNADAGAGKRDGGETRSDEFGCCDFHVRLSLLPGLGAADGEIRGSN